MKSLLNPFLNSLAVLMLVGLIAAPIYFAQNFAQVAGVKTQESYLLVSQIAKFPGMTLTQSAQNYSITFTKFATKQAYLATLILNNPTNMAQSYEIVNKSEGITVFFGEDLKNLETKISIPSQASVPISVLSQDTSSSSQNAAFNIRVN